MKSPDIVIVGAGIVGACVASALAEAGARVSVLTAGWPGRGTSAASFAWVNSANKPPEAYHRLNAASFLAYRRLRDRLGADAGIHMDGTLTWVETDEERLALRQQYDRLKGWDYPVEWVAPARITQEIAPELRLDPDRVQQALYMPSEGWIDAPLLIQRLLEEVRRRDGDVRWDSRVREVQRSRNGGRVRSVVTESGDRVSAGVVINCAGPDAERVAAGAGVRLPLTRVPGMLIVTDRIPVGLRPVVRPPGPSFRPDGGGRIAILIDGMPQAAPDPIDPVPSLPPPPRARAALEQVKRWLPALDAARIEAARLGVRPMPLDGCSIVGPHPELPGFYIVVTHSGITLGPVLGPLVAAEIMSGRPESILEPFRPDRFLRERK